MSLAYLAQPEQQPTVEWLAGGTFTVLLDAAATNGQLGVGRFRVSKGEAPPASAAGGTEYYLTDRHDTPDESQWVTEIGWPIFHTGGNPQTSPGGAY